MTFDEFSSFIDSVCPTSECILDVWHNWAKELRDMDNPDNESDSAEFKSVETFLGELAYAIDVAYKEHGEEVAKQIIMLVQIPACPFPWEIKEAANHLAKGGDVNDIPQMEVDGKLEDINDYLTWSKTIRDENFHNRQMKGFNYEIQGL